MGYGGWGRHWAYGGDWPDGRHWAYGGDWPDGRQHMDDYSRKHDIQRPKLFDGRMLLSADWIKLYRDTPDSHHSGPGEQLF